MNQIINTLNYDLNRMSAMDLISVIHIDDFNTRFIKLSLSDRGSPFSVAGSTVIARFVTVNGVLLNDNVSCTVTEDGKILIPIDAAAVNSVACDLKIEVNITQGTDVLTLPFPLWVRVRGSILETSGISPESQGTIPDLLHQVQEELQRVQGFTDEDEVYEILDNTLSGNRNISPTLLVDRVTDQTYNPNGDLILYYIDSDDVRHNIFNFSPYLGTRNYNALQNRPVIRGRDVSSNVNTALEGYLNFGSDGFTVSTYQGPDKEIDVELSRSVPNCKTASNDWAGYYDFNNLAGIYAGAGVFRVSANKALNKPAALANIVGDLCITHLATIADGATLIRYVTGVNVDGDILNYLQKATLEKRTALSYDVVSQSAWQEVAVTKMLDTALSGNNPNSAMTLNLDNIVDQAANPYGHLMLYYIDSDWTRHNIFDFTEEFYTISEVQDLIDSLREFYAPRSETAPTKTVGFDADGIPEVILSATTFSGGACTNTSIKKLYVPSTVTRIDSGAFYSCTALTDVYIDNTATGITVSNSAFPSGVIVHYHTNVGRMTFNVVDELIKAVHSFEEDLANAAY